MISFKSDRCGIETVVFAEIGWTPAEFKSDRCGIETYNSIAFRVIRDGSNQTVAGLKLPRTRVDPLTFPRFKSDRCGIETYLFKEIITMTTKFKSDRCGIETD